MVDSIGGNKPVGLPSSLKASSTKKKRPKSPAKPSLIELKNELRALLLANKDSKDLSEKLVTKVAMTMLGNLQTDSKDVQAVIEKSLEKMQNHPELHNLFDVSSKK